MQNLGKRLARGEAAAFAELYDMCADTLYQYLTVRLGDHDVAADVLQEVFLRLVRLRRRLKKVENPLAYALAVARNESNRWIARHKKTPTTSRQPVEELPAGEGSNPATAREAADSVAAALSQLDDDDRELVELKIYGGLTFREIAEVVELPPATVATRYRRAMLRMREWLERHTR